MRALPLAVAGLLALAVFAPVAAAGPTGPQPPPCIICVIIFGIVVPCLVAEAQQDVLNSGDGCVIVNAQQDCVQAEVDQDAFNSGDGCAYVNSQQSSLECRVRSVEAQVGLAQPC
jgi:hypothetical protein